MGYRTQGTRSGGINMSINLTDNYSNTMRKVDEQNKRTQKSMQQVTNTLDRQIKQMLYYDRVLSNNTMQRRVNNEQRLRQQALNNEQRDNRARELEMLRHTNRMEEIQARKSSNKTQQTGGGINFFNLQNLASAFYLVEKIFRAVKGVVDDITNSVDTILSQKGRLGLYNTTGQSTGAVYQYMANTALESRSDLTATAELVNRLLASEVYSGQNATTKTIDTVGLINKALVAGGGTTREVQSTLLQLSQGLAQGQLQGQELKAIRQYAPYLGNVIIEGLKKQGLGEYSLGDLKELGSSGMLTTERVLKSIELMAEQINKDFEQMPKTWGQAMTNMRTQGSMFLNMLQESNSSIQDLYNQMWNFSDFLASDDSAKFWENLALGANLFFTLATMGLSALQDGLIWVVEHLDAIIGVATILFTVFAIGFISTHAALFATLAVLYILVKVFDEFGISGIQILAIIVGFIAVLIDLVGRLATAISSGLVAAFKTLGSIALGILSSIAQAIGRILDALGIDWGQSLVNWGAKAAIDAKWLKEEADAKWAEAGDAIFKGEPDKVYTDAYNQIMGLSGKFEDFKNTLKEYDPEALRKGVGGVPGTDYPIDTNVTGGKLDSAGEVDLSNEDIQLLRDIAARDYLINVSTVTPVMNNSFGDIRETADINKIMDELERMVDEELATSVVVG